MISLVNLFVQNGKDVGALTSLFADFLLLFAVILTKEQVKMDHGTLHLQIE